MTKKEIHEALGRAYNAGWRLKNIAAEAGVTFSSIRQFRSAETMGKEGLDKLDAWLKSKGYDNPDAPKSLRQSLAQEMRTCANIMESREVPDRLAFKRFHGMYVNYIEAIEEAGLIKLIKE